MGLDNDNPDFPLIKQRIRKIMPGKSALETQMSPNCLEYFIFWTVCRMNYSRVVMN